MTDNRFSTLAEDYAAALEWWREAGVDTDYVEEAHQWLRPPEIAQAPAPPPIVRIAARPQTAMERALAPAAGAPLGGDRARWPSDLDAFRAFWLTEPSLDPGALGDRVAPIGDAGAALMVLVAQPDEGDREALLTGEQGALLTRIIQAMGVDGAQVYRASALPRVTPMPDWDELTARGLGEITRLHVALAAPRRLIAFGRAPAMLVEGCGIPTLAAPQLEALARSPARKRQFWTAWLEFSA